MGLDRCVWYFVSGPFYSLTVDFFRSVAGQAAGFFRSVSLRDSLRADSSRFQHGPVRSTQSCSYREDRDSPSEQRLMREVNWGKGAGVCRGGLCLLSVLFLCVLFIGV